MRNPLITLAETAAGWGRRDLSPDIEWATRRAVLDWFATTLPGCAELPANLVLGALADEKTYGLAICYVDGSTRSPRQAAMVNAIANRRPVFRYGAPRAMAATCPVHRHEGSTAVFKGVFRRNLDLADLRKLSARMAVPYRALNSSRTPFGNKPF